MWWCWALVGGAAKKGQQSTLAGKRYVSFLLPVLWLLGGVVVWLLCGLSVADFFGAAFFLSLDWLPYFIQETREGHSFSEYSGQRGRGRGRGTTLQLRVRGREWTRYKGDTCGGDQFGVGIGAVACSAQVAVEYTEEVCRYKSWCVGDGHFDFLFPFW